MAPPDSLGTKSPPVSRPSSARLSVLSQVSSAPTALRGRVARECARGLLSEVKPNLFRLAGDTATQQLFAPDLQGRVAKECAFRLLQEVEIATFGRKVAVDVDTTTVPKVRRTISKQGVAESQLRARQGSATIDRCAEDPATSAHASEGSVDASPVLSRAATEDSDVDFVAQKLTERLLLEGLAEPPLPPRLPVSSGAPPDQDDAAAAALVVYIAGEDLAFSDSDASMLSAGAAAVLEEATMLQQSSTMACTTTDSQTSPTFGFQSRQEGELSLSPLPASDASAAWLDDTDVDLTASHLVRDAVQPSISKPPLQEDQTARGSADRTSDLVESACSQATLSSLLQSMIPLSGVQGFTDTSELTTGRDSPGDFLHSSGMLRPSVTLGFKEGSEASGGTASAAPEAEPSAASANVHNERSSVDQDVAFELVRHVLEPRQSATSASVAGGGATMGSSDGLVAHIVHEEKAPTEGSLSSVHVMRRDSASQSSGTYARDVVALKVIPEAVPDESSSGVRDMKRDKALLSSDSSATEDLVPGLMRDAMSETSNGTHQVLRASTGVSSGTTWKEDLVAGLIREAAGETSSGTHDWEPGPALLRGRSIEKPEPQVEAGKAESESSHATRDMHRSSGDDSSESLNREELILGMIHDCLPTSTESSPDPSPDLLSAALHTGDDEVQSSGASCDIQRTTTSASFGSVAQEDAVHRMVEDCLRSEGAAQAAHESPKQKPRKQLSSAGRSSGTRVLDEVVSRELAEVPPIGDAQLSADLHSKAMPQPLPPLSPPTRRRSSGARSSAVSAEDEMVSHVLRRCVAAAESTCSSGSIDRSSASSIAEPVTLALQAAAVVELPLSRTLQLQYMPESLEYPTLPDVLPCGHACSHRPHFSSTLKPSVSGFTVSPFLPRGLQLEAHTGEIHGTPEEPTAFTAYAVIAFLDVMSELADSGAADAPEKKRLVCSIRLKTETLLAPRNLYYPVTACSVSLESSTWLRRRSGARSTTSWLPDPLAVSPPQTPASPRKSPRHRQPLSPAASAPESPEIRVAPSLSGGAAKLFEVSPKLPLGLHLDEYSGEIMGAPALGEAQCSSTRHTVLAENQEGLALCEILVEVREGGGTGRPIVSLRTLWSRDQCQDQVARVEVAMLPLGRPTSPIRPTSNKTPRRAAQVRKFLEPLRQAHQHERDVDWSERIAQSAVIVRSCGRRVPMRDFDASSSAIVKGMPASSVLRCMGVGEEPRMLRSFLRAIDERRADAPVDHPALAATDRSLKRDHLVYIPNTTRYDVPAIKLDVKKPRGSKLEGLQGPSLRGCVPAA